MVLLVVNDGLAEFHVPLKVSNQTVHKVPLQLQLAKLCICGQRYLTIQYIFFIKSQTHSFICLQNVAVCQWYIFKKIALLIVVFVKNQQIVTIQLIQKALFRLGLSSQRMDYKDRKVKLMIFL